jgi:hypothetical protein
MTETLQPLRLAVGSHKAGTGKGCAMNVISWENGDQQITDYPKCADPFLARVVQIVNDEHCTHRSKDRTDMDRDLLCPACSVDVLTLAHRTVGTSGGMLRQRIWARRQRIWARLAVGLAWDKLPHLGGEAQRLGEEILPLANDWLNGPGGRQALLAAGLRDWADRADWLPVLAVRATALAAMGGREPCRDLAAKAWYESKPRSGTLLTHAHRLFDDFEQLTGATGHTPATDAVDAAITLMLTQEEAAL